MKKFATFGYVVGVFLPRKFKLNYENFKLVGQRKCFTFVVRPITIGKGVAGTAWESDGIR
jgi:hypothetical protein